MITKTLMAAALAVGFVAADVPEADAYGIVRVAPVRRVAARTVLPPYPVARRVVARPRVVAPIVRPAVVRPVVRPVVAAPVYGPVYAAPVYGGAVYSGPAYYRGGVSVSVGW